MSDSRQPGSYTPWYPNFVFVEAVAALVVLAGLVLLAVVWQVPLEEAAHPSDTTYVPRPEWYFLAYFQLLKYFEGSLAIVGEFFIPLALVAGLLLLPFLDRNRETRPRKRPLAVLLALAALALGTGLTAQALIEDARDPRIRWMALPPVTEEQVAEGKANFDRFCVLCHAMDGKGGFMATDLTQIGGRASRTYIENVIIDPKIVSQETIMSLIPLNEHERHGVSAYLSTKR